VTASLALKANLASPTFTGAPTLPSGTIGVTQVVGDNTTALATTEFVTAANATNANLTGHVTSIGNATTIANGVVTNDMLVGLIDLTSKVTGALPISNGGTGSITQNFVDLTTDQTIGGVKFFNSDLSVNGLIVGKGPGNDVNNTVVGYNGLLNNTSGTFNTVFGMSVLANNTSGTENTGIGWKALANNITSSYNTSTGYMSLYYSNGNNNTANGYRALFGNTSGMNNTAIGIEALNANTTGSSNTAIGSGADVLTDNLYNATAIGSGAIVEATDAIQLGNTNVTNVKTSGTLTAGMVTYPKTHGSANQVLSTTGSGTLTWTTPTAISIGSIGSSNVNGASITSGVINLAPANGTNGGIVTTAAQTFAGAKIFNSDLTVNGLTVGLGGGNKSTNSANGFYALYSNTDGSNNSANGYFSLYSNTTGSDNTANGYFTLYSNTSGSNNIGIGRYALYSNTLGNFNTTNGVSSLYSNTSGSNNAAYGYASLYSNSLGSNNTAIGVSSLFSNTGSGNTSIGYNSGLTNTSGSDNTTIGKNSDVSVNNLINATAIGSGAIVTASNTIQLGNSSVTNVKTSGTLTAGTVTYPNTHGSANQVLSTTGSGTLTWATPTAISVGSIGISNVNGASIASGVLSLAPADGTNGGIVTTGAQTFAGTKTFSGEVIGGNTTTSKISGFAANMNTQTGTTYQLTTEDNGKIITLNNSSAITLTVPTLFTGFNCMIVQLGSGLVTLTTSGTTISNRSSFTKTAGTNAIVTIIALSSTTFISAGDMQ
ncbi:MAG: hypothetical protein WCG74_09990, partial [Sediminibacterium sp.]